MTDEIKERVRARLERIWKYNEGILAGLDHQLIVMAVPTYPANIEAVSAMDISDIADLLSVFTKERENGNARPVENIERESETASAPAGQAFGVPIGSAIPRNEPLGQGYNGGGSPQERAEPAPEANEGQPAAAAGGLERDVKVVDTSDGVSRASHCS